MPSSDFELWQSRRADGLAFHNHAGAPASRRRWLVRALAILLAAALCIPGMVKADGSNGELPAYLLNEDNWSHPIAGAPAAPTPAAQPAAGPSGLSAPTSDGWRASKTAPQHSHAGQAPSTAAAVKDTALARCLDSHDWSRTPWTTCGSAPIPLSHRAEVPSVLLGRPRALIDAWNGAALGPDRMYFHGGGHHDYGGNEVIGFNYHNLVWDFRMPLDITPEGRPVASYPLERFADDIYPSGGPGATHTYDGIVYAPTTGEVFRFGGVGYWPRGSRVQNLSNATVFVFDTRAEQPRWQHVGDVPPALTANGPSVKSRFDPRSGQIVVRGRYGKAEFDPATRTWSLAKLWSQFESQGSIGNDPTGQVVWYADNKQMWVETNGVRAMAAGPYDSRRPFCSKQGMDWHPSTRRLVVWCGNAEVRSWDPANDRWESYRPADDAAPHPRVGRSKGVFSKWAYLDAYDIFIGYNNTKQGIWFFRLPASSTEDPRRARLAAQGFECADGVLDWRCPNLEAALTGDKALPTGIYRSGAVIDRAGTYDFAGSQLIRAIRGKAAVIVRRDGVTLRNLACREIAVRSGNGACVRQQARTLRIENARMTDGQSFLLGNPNMQAVVIDGLEIQNVGGDCRRKCGRAHGIYFNANQGELTVRNASLRRGRDAAHLIKSGAAITLVENSVLDERDGAGSRAIDVYNGGHLILRNVTIHARADDGNREVIGWDYEQRADHQDNRITFDNVTIFCDRGSRLLGYRPGNAPTLENADAIAWPNGRCL